MASRVAQGIRTFIKGDGSDSTTALMAFLATRPDKIWSKDLYLIGDNEDPQAYRITDHSSPLLWRPYGTFQPQNKISRGQITTKIGLEVTKLQVNWTPPNQPFLQTSASANPYTRAITGQLDNKPVKVFRTIMPTPGDCETYGATTIFGGRISGITVQRGDIQFDIDSFLNVINMLVPPNVIENTNTVAGFKGATPVIPDGETVVATFSVVAPTSTTIIDAACLGPTPNKIYDNNKFQFGYMVFTTGALAGYFATIGQNFRVTLGGVHYNQFFNYAAFPWPPSPGDQFYVSFKFPVDQGDPGATLLGPGDVGYFPYVPSPETAV